MRLDLLEVGHGRLPGIAGVEQSLPEKIFLGEHIGDTAHPGGDQPPLQLHQQRTRQPPAAPGRRDRDPHHPAPLTCDTRECRPDGRTLVDGHHGRLPRGQRADALGEREDGLLPELGRGVDQVDHFGEIVLAVVVDEPVHRYRPSLVMLVMWWQ